MKQMSQGEVLLINAEAKNSQGHGGRGQMGVNMGLVTPFMPIHVHIHARSKTLI